jgi:hypothetical protein
MKKVDEAKGEYGAPAEEDRKLLSVVGRKGPTGTHSFAKYYWRQSAGLDDDNRYDDEPHAIIAVMFCDAHDALHSPH